MRTAVVDGFVAHCDALDDERRTIVEERRLPIVVLDGRPEPGEPAVGIDEEGGTYAAADHVLSLGHRRLAVVRLPAAHVRDGQHAARAPPRRLPAAAAAHGLDPARVPVVDGFACDRAR